MNESLLPPELLFIQRGWLNSNHLIIQDRGAPVLIDSGHLACVEETLSTLRAAGVEPETLGQIVSTHGHADHHGANRALKELSGAPVALGEITARWFAEGDLRSPWLGQFSQESEIVQADIIYSPGTRIELSGVPFEVLSLPGHAPDSIGFYQPDSRVLVCADAMWENDLGVLHPAVHGWEVLDEAELAIKKILALDVAVAVPGHGPLLTDVETSAAAVLKRLESFRREPVRLVRHLLRRFLMYSILRCQPIPLEQLVEELQLDQWGQIYLQKIRDETQRAALTSEELLHELIEEFMRRGLTAETETGLVCRLPR